MRIETQFSIFLVNRPGVLGSVTEALAEAGVNVYALSLSDSGEHGVLRIVTDDAEATRDVLKEAHDRWTETDVLIMELPNQPGQFAKIAKCLSSNELNISYAYYTGPVAGAETVAVFKLSSLEKAMDVLKNLSGA